jgi:hypothetical protein
MVDSKAVGKGDWKAVRWDGLMADHWVALSVVTMVDMWADLTVDLRAVLMGAPMAVPRDLTMADWWDEKRADQMAVMWAGESAATMVAWKVFPKAVAWGARKAD